MKIKIDKEFLYDIAFRAGWFKVEILNENSSPAQQRFDLILEWAQEFTNIHQLTDWQKEDYWLTVDEFVDLKITEAVVLGKITAEI